MPYDVYVVGIFDDYMTYYLVDQENWDKIGFSPGNREWDGLVIKELMNLTPEELVEFEADEATGDTSNWEPISWDLEELLDAVKTGKINVLGSVEGYNL